ncbi:MAG: hypothetical protein AAFU78_02040 [Cyanobacteria bacterium J06633_2]
MNQEVIRNFLNLPGIIGVALIDRQARHFFAIDQHHLNWRQKDALSTGIQQIILTTPPTIDCFEFQFSHHRVYTYRLQQAYVLLVLASNSLEYAAYFPVLSMLKSELQVDLNNAIASFRLAISNASTQKQPISSASDTPSQEQSMPMSSSTNGVIVREEIPSVQPALQEQLLNGYADPTDSDIQNGQDFELNSTVDGSPSSTSTTSADLSVADKPAPLTDSTAPPLLSEEPLEETLHDDENGHTISAPDASVHVSSIDDVLDALNQFSKIAARYLGATIVSNYWKSSRPAIEWLSSFEIDRKGHITFSQADVNGESRILNQEQLEWLSEWLTEFIQRCSSVIRSFPSVIQTMDLTPTQRSLLLPGSP